MSNAEMVQYWNEGAGPIWTRYEEMLDARYIRENPRFTAAPANRKPVANPRAVLAEEFTGAG